MTLRHPISISLVRLASTTLALVSVTACAEQMIVSGKQYNAQIWREDAEKVSSSAAFELKCPKEQLQLSSLGAEYFADKIGVEGCGHRAVYVKVMSSGQRAWVMNSSDMGK